MIVIFNEDDSNNLPDINNVLWQATIALMQNSDGTITVMKDRYTGITGTETTITHITRMLNDDFRRGS